MSRHAAAPEIYTLSLHDALPILLADHVGARGRLDAHGATGLEADLEVAHDVAHHGERLRRADDALRAAPRSEEHTSELQSRLHLVCRLPLEKKKISLWCVGVERR